ncbi:hypothetical protein SN15_05855 [Stenotrophomonas maltophilia]|nr:hypothetical protein SN15_05855 [Stenotrophomonas maltophilia]
MTRPYPIRLPAWRRRRRNRSPGFVKRADHVDLFPPRLPGGEDPCRCWHCGYQEPPSRTDCRPLRLQVVGCPPSQPTASCRRASR